MGGVGGPGDVLVLVNVHGHSFGGIRYGFGFVYVFQVVPLVVWERQSLGIFWVQLHMRPGTCIWWSSDVGLSAMPFL